MPIYTLSARQEVSDAVAAGLPVADRLIALAMTAGYVIGPGGVQVLTDGSVVIDADRDPTADWLSFNPAALTASETASANLRTQVIAYLETLADNETALVAGIATLKGPTPPSTIAQLRPYVTNLAEMTLDHNRGLERLIRVLIDRHVIEES